MKKERTKKPKAPTCPLGLPEDIVAHAEQIAKIAERTAKVEEGLDFILNKVSANGRPGLENSLRDIHTEVKGIRTAVDAVLDATKSTRAWGDVRKSIRTLMKESLIGGVLRNKVGRMIVILAIVLALNSLLRAAGFELDIQSILRLVF